MIVGDAFHSHLVMEKDAVCLQRLYTLAKRRLEYRLAKGAVELNVNETEMRVRLDKGTEPYFQFYNHSTESKSALLVKEMMLAAGEAAALYAQQRSWILPFRGQEKTNVSEG